MKKVLCFVLIMALVLSMSCVAFAAESDVASPGSGSGGSGSTGGSGSSNVPSTDGNPKTGDSFVFYVMTMLATLMALAAAVFTYRKNFAC